MGPRRGDITWANMRSGRHSNHVRRDFCGLSVALSTIAPLCALRSQHELRVRCRGSDGDPEAAAAARLRRRAAAAAAARRDDGEDAVTPPPRSRPAHDLTPGQPADDLLLPCSPPRTPAIHAQPQARPTHSRATNPPYCGTRRAVRLVRWPVELKALGEQLQEQLRGIVALQSATARHRQSIRATSASSGWSAQFRRTSPRCCSGNRFVRCELLRRARAARLVRRFDAAGVAVPRRLGTRRGRRRDPAAGAAVRAWQNRYRDEAARAHELASRVYALDGELEVAREELARLKSASNRRSVQHAEELGRASRTAPHSPGESGARRRRPLSQGARPLGTTLTARPRRARRSSGAIRARAAAEHQVAARRFARHDGRRRGAARAHGAGERRPERAAAPGGARARAASGARGGVHRHITFIRSSLSPPPAAASRATRAGRCPPAPARAMRPPWSRPAAARPRAA